jgi:hypothetical protein
MKYALEEWSVTMVAFSIAAYRCHTKFISGWDKEFAVIKQKIEADGDNFYLLDIFAGNHPWFDGYYQDVRSYLDEPSPFSLKTTNVETKTLVNYLISHSCQEQFLILLDALQFRFGCLEACTTGVSDELLK